MTAVERRARARKPKVAILGAGIMGSTIALALARRKVSSVLIDASPAPFCGASRYNEGKIHLGYLYLGDPSLATAHKIIPGGLRFGSIVADLLDMPLDALRSTQHNDTYLIHRNSVVAPEAAAGLIERIAALAISHPDAGAYLASLRDNPPRRLSPPQLATCTDSPDILAGFEVPERSISTLALADTFVDALAACEAIEQCMNHRVTDVMRPDHDHGAWHVQTLDTDGRPERLGPFDAVVNALWQGRPAIDARLGLRQPRTWTHRYRLSVFARTLTPCALPSTVIAVGPFGDVKNYDGRNLYLSWYPSGLIAEGHDLDPPTAPLPDPDHQTRIVKDKLMHLAQLVKGVKRLESRFESVQLRGGWVYAAGHGALSDPMSRLHRRDDIGLVQQGRYFSIDTGKYSTAPLMAQEVSEAVCIKLET